MNKDQRAKQRSRTAREAAEILYTRQENEYKQAKLHAAKILGASFLPSNIEVAKELDQIAEEREGEARRKTLIQMREDALRIMSVLKRYNPVLVGSVWRGTNHHSSDIDIVTFTKNPQQIIAVLKQGCYAIERMELQTVTKEEGKKASFHIHVRLPSKNIVEVVVRSSEEANHKVSCDIYGDIASGLNLKQLQKVMKENPLQRFVPS